MNRQNCIAIGFLIGGSTLYGQSPAEYKGMAYQFATTSSSEPRVVFGDTLGSQIVTGKPFSATEERHSIQVLGDGTHIENSETNRLFRDEQGRTRIERKGGNISIFDPVAGFSAELNPTTKTVSKTTVIVREGRIAGKTTAVYSTGGNKAELAGRLDKLKEEMEQAQIRTADQGQIARLKAQIADTEKALGGTSPATNFYFTVPAPAGQPSGGGGSVSPLQAETLKKQAAEIQVRGGAISTYTYNVSTGDGPVILRVGPGDNGSVESLPTQMVNGALAQGTRTTETIPVGKIGNDRAMSIVNERWYSNDLQMLVKSTSTDPRFGDTTYQMTGIVQASPDPSLFQIPADYSPRK